MTDREKLIADLSGIVNKYGVTVQERRTLIDVAAALSAPERPVPTLPEGMTVTRDEEGDFKIQGPEEDDVEWYFVKKGLDMPIERLFSAFLPKSPLDELAAQAQELNMGYGESPAEPVQAAGDGVGERKAFDVWYESFDWPASVDVKDIARKAFNGGVAWGRPITSPASPPDQGQDQSAPMKQEAKHKIVAGLEEAVAYARGDKSQGREFTITPGAQEAKPERESLEQAFKTKFGVPLSEWMTGGYTPAGAEVVGWIIRIMDQNKLDEKGW